MQGCFWGAGWGRSQALTLLPRSPSREAHEEGDGHGQAAARQDPEDPPEWEAAALVTGPVGSLGTLPLGSSPPRQ